MKVILPTLPDGHQYPCRGATRAIGHAWSAMWKAVAVCGQVSRVRVNNRRIDGDCRIQ